MAGLIEQLGEREQERHGQERGLAGTSKDITSMNANLGKLRLVSKKFLVETTPQYDFQLDNPNSGLDLDSPLGGLDSPNAPSQWDKYHEDLSIYPVMSSARQRILSWLVGRSNSPRYGFIGYGYGDGVFDETKTSLSNQKGISITKKELVEVPLGEPLPYWIESYERDGSAQVLWIRTTIKSGENKIYLFKNKTSPQDPSKVFDFWEDFNDDSLSSDKWEIHKHYGGDSVWIENSSLNIKGVETGVASMELPSGYFYLGMRVKTGIDNGSFANTIIADTTTHTVDEIIAMNSQAWNSSVLIGASHGYKQGVYGENFHSKYRYWISGGKSEDFPNTNSDDYHHLTLIYSPNSSTWRDDSTGLVLSKDLSNPDPSRKRLILHATYDEQVPGFPWSVYDYVYIAMNVRTLNEFSSYSINDNGYYYELVINSSEDLGEVLLYLEPSSFGITSDEEELFISLGKTYMTRIIGEAIPSLDGETINEVGIINSEGELLLFNSFPEYSYSNDTYMRFMFELYHDFCLPVTKRFGELIIRELRGEEQGIPSHIGFSDTEIVLSDNYLPSFPGEFIRKAVINSIGVDEATWMATLINTEGVGNIIRSVALFNSETSQEPLMIWSGLGFTKTSHDNFQQIFSIRMR